MLHSVVYRGGHWQRGGRAVTRAVAAPVDAGAASSHGRVYNFSAGPAVLPVDVLE